MASGLKDCEVLQNYNLFNRRMRFAKNLLNTKTIILLILIAEYRLILAHLAHVRSHMLNISA